MKPEGPSLVELYKAMARLRAVDQKMLNLQRQGRIGFYGTAFGEEAAVVGSAAALRPDDWVFPALRQAGVLLGRASPCPFIAQCMGNSDPRKAARCPCTPPRAPRGLLVLLHRQLTLSARPTP